MIISLDCIPPKSTAQGSTIIMKSKSGRPFIGKSSNSKAAKAKKQLIDLLIKHKPRKPFKNAVKVLVQWRYPWNKSEPKRNRPKWRYCTTRPDCDNLMKLLFDVMTKLGFWKDDSLIADVRFVKMYCDNPGIYIEIKQLEI